MKQLLTVLSLCALLLVSCKSDSTTGTNNNNNNNNNNTNNAPANTMIVTIDGTTYTWTAVGAKSGGTITVSGADAAGDKVAGFNMSNVTGPGTYSTGSATTIVTLTYGYPVGSDEVVYSTIPGASSGSITVQELTDSTCKATFSGTLTKISGASGSSTATFTNGSVNAHLY
jgi:hypothetical protein